MVVCRIKFYADTPKGEKNKYFCWNVDSILKAEERLVFFLKQDYSIRAAFFEQIDTETGEVKENSKFNMQDVYERNF